MAIVEQQENVPKHPQEAKPKQPAPSPTSVFDMLSLSSPASSVATTPGMTPPSAQARATPVRRSARARPPAPAGRTHSGKLPPHGRGRTAEKPQTTASVLHPWWQAGPATQALGLGRRPVADLPPRHVPAQPATQRSPQATRPAKARDVPTPSKAVRRSGGSRSSRDCSRRRASGEAARPPSLPPLQLSERSGSLSSSGSLSLHRTGSGGSPVQFCCSPPSYV